MFLKAGPRTFLKTLYPQLAQVASGSLDNSSAVTRVPQRTHSNVAAGKTRSGFSLSPDIPSSHWEVRPDKSH